MSKRNTHRRSLRRGGLAALAAAAGILGSALLAPSASAATLGGVNMQLACDRQPASRGLGLTAKVRDPHNAFSWVCTNNFGYTTGIDVNWACANQYGTGASAGLSSTTNPYSWYCKR
jgi:hypothetical protein